MFSFKRSSIVNGAIALGVAIALILFANPSRALQVQVNPKTPQLGDTISVVSTAPTSIKMGAKDYPSFDVGNGRYRALLPTTPLDRPGRINLAVNSGSDSETLPLTLRNRRFPTQSIWLPPGKGNNGTDMEFDRVDAFKAIVSPEKFWNGKFLRPNNGSTTTGYGVRRYYNGVFAKDYFHRGVDYAGAPGSAIVAPAAGRVVLIGRESDGFKIHGNCVGIDHGQGVASIFLHMSRIDVKEGDFVKAGQRLGGLGSTGASTGPHLHWGLYVHGQAVDPVPWRNQGFE